jgi:two-component system sensor histidine kinase KdpD
MSAFFPVKSPYRYAIGLGTWLLGCCVLLVLDQQFDLANLSLVLVLTSALAAIWLPLSLTFLVSVIALMAFNWSFVPPRGTFAIDFHQHALLLLAMFVVNVIVAGLMVSLREHTRRANAYADTANALRNWSEKLRDGEDPYLLLTELQNQLGELSNARVHLFIDRCEPAADIGKDARDALEYCRASNQALGPGTGRYEDLAANYIPLRGRCHAAGAVMFTPPAGQPELLAQAQAMCDQMGLAIERQQLLLREQKTRDQVQAQNLRNTFLAAVSHDFRTPLATIVSAASSLQTQAERLTEVQRQQLLAGILDEAERLRRQTSNLLQLARLDGISEVGEAIQPDWESLEEIIGSVLHRSSPERRALVDVEIAADLPLLRADSLLLAQLLENLVDNAFKYGPANARVKILAHVDTQLVLAVEDQGPGINPLELDPMFDIFQRGDHRQSGTGVGLALCRAITRAHGGELLYLARAGYSRFECRLPLPAQPAILPVVTPGTAS